MQAEAPFNQRKGSHRAPPKQYGLTTSSSAPLASHSSQNYSPFPVSLLLLYNLGNVTGLVDFDLVLVDFDSVLADFDLVLVDFDLVLAFGSDTCPVLLY